jgi:hypothetical protein
VWAVDVNTNVRRDIIRILIKACEVAVSADKQTIYVYTYAFER